MSEKENTLLIIGSHWTPLIVAIAIGLALLVIEVLK